MTGNELSAATPHAITQLLTWLRTQYGDDIELASEPTRAHAGMDTTVWFLELRGHGLDADLADAWRAPLVVRIHRTPDRSEVARREAAAQEWCIERGYPAPRILFVGSADEGFTTPIQVMARAPGIPMLDAITRRPWQIRPMLHQLGSLQARLHAIPSSDWPDADVTFAQRRLEPVREWATQLNDPAVGDALVSVRRMAEILDRGPACVCHGDFHPLNVIVDGRDATVIDWTDAGLGDPMGDVARSALLLRVAGVATTQPALRMALTAVAPAMSATYLRAYRRAAVFDPDRFNQWTTLHLFHAWVQVRALHAGLIGSESERDQIPLGLADWIHRRFVRASSTLG